MAWGGVMTLWHSGASRGSVGGASAELADGGTSTQRCAVTRSPFRAGGSASSRVGCQGQTSSAGWEPAGCLTSTSGVCVVALSGSRLTLACRIGRKSARPGAGNIAPFFLAEQMRCEGRRADLYVSKRPSRFATHTAQRVSSPILYNRRYAACAPDSGVSLTRSNVQRGFTRLNAKPSGRCTGGRGSAMGG